MKTSKSGTAVRLLLGLGLSISAAPAMDLLDDHTLRIEDRIDSTLGGSRRFGHQLPLGLRVGF